MGVRPAIVLGLLLLALGIPAPAGAVVVYRDDFSGPAGGYPNAAVWRALPCQYLVRGSDCTASRARLDGAGALELIVTPSRGAFIGTFDYGTGWPPTGVRASWAPPFTITARLKMPTTPGIWTVVYAMNTDRTRSRGIWELDIAEPRSSLPNTGAAYHHWWGTTHTTGGASAWIGGPGQWHTYRLIARQDKTIYTVDGKTLLTREPLAGRFGLLIHSLAGLPNTWHTNYGPTMASGTTVRSKIDYVEVSR